MPDHRRMTTAATPSAAHELDGRDRVRADITLALTCWHCGGPTKGVTDGLSPAMYAAKCLKCGRLGGWWLTPEAAWNDPPRRRKADRP